MWGPVYHRPLVYGVGKWFSKPVCILPAKLPLPAKGIGYRSTVMYRSETVITVYCNVILYTAMYYIKIEHWICIKNSLNCILQALLT